MNKIRLILVCFSLFLVGCSEEEPTATVDCPALITAVDTTETAFDADQTTETCNALLIAAQAAFDGGCTFCDAGEVACLADDSNEATCCDEPTQADLDELTTACSGDFSTPFPGTYTMSGMSDYPGGDCSVASDAVTGMCSSNEDITIEADCPTGVCFGDLELSETNCPDDQWVTGYCEAEDDGSYYTEETCEAAGWNWEPFGWMNFSDRMDMTFTFSDDGTYKEPDFMCENNDGHEIDAIDEAACLAAGGEVHAEQGTWTLSGSTLSLIEDTFCEDFVDVDIEPTDEAACLAAGGEWLNDEPIVCEISGDSFTCSMANDAECHTSGPEDGAEPANEADCEAADGHWEDAGCIEFTFTKI